MCFAQLILSQKIPEWSMGGGFARTKKARFLIHTKRRDAAGKKKREDSFDEQGTGDLRTIRTS